MNSDLPIARTEITAPAGNAPAASLPAPARVLELQDNRAFYVTGAVLAVGLLFGSLIFFTAHAEPRQRRISLAESTHLADESAS